MRLFRARQSADSPHPVFAFWDWWRRDGHAVNPHAASPKVVELNRRVLSIDNGLAWHFSAGTESEHRLTVSAGGQAALRPLAERWLRAAPPADATWEFRASQEAEPSALSNIVEIGKARVDLSKTLFSLQSDVNRMRVDVGVYHPQFGALQEEVRTQISFLVLDWLLGEDDVERWLGVIETLTALPTPSATPDDVVAAVAGLAEQRNLDEWVLVKWADTDGFPVIASSRKGLRWNDFPTLDQHLTVYIPFESRDDGLPADGGVLDSLHTLEDELEETIRGRGILVGHETTQGRRSFHVYLDSEDQNASQPATDWAVERGSEIRSDKDPAWTAVRHLTG